MGESKSGVLVRGSSVCRGGGEKGRDGCLNWSSNVTQDALDLTLSISS